MRILLLNPSSHFILRMLQDISLPEIPLSLAYLATVLEKEGHSIKIIDMNVIRSKNDFLEQIKDEQFDIMGFASTTPIIESCYRLIHVMKHSYPAAKIIIGGWHASALPLQTMEECKDIDFVVKGEGEETIVELVRAIDKGESVTNIKGIVYKDMNEIPHENEDRPLIKDLDSLPFPARNLLPLDAYKKIGFYTIGGYFKREFYISPLFSSRGCANRCRFCADHVIYKETCRFRSPENVIAEIEEMISKYHIRIILFLDANFMLSPKRVKRICEMIIERKLKFIWACNARVDTVSEDILRLMKQAGCIRIAYGIESGSPRILKLMNKNITIKQIRDAVRLTKKVGISVYTLFVYGMPGETFEDMQMSRQLLMEIKPDFVTQSVVVPYPGTDVYDEAISQGLIKNAGWESFSYFFHPVLEIPDARKTFSYQKKIQRDFYTSPFFLWNMVKKMRSIYHVKFYFDSLRIFLLFFFYPSLKRP